MKLKKLVRPLLASGILACIASLACATPALASWGWDTPKMVPAPYQPGGFEAGMTLYVNTSDYADQADLANKLRVLLDELVDDHVNALSLVWPIYTGDVTSSALFKGDGTPSDDDIAFITRTAMARGFIVTFRPIIDEHSLRDAQQDWRGTIRPASVPAWFAAYSTIMLQYADLAQSNGAHAFIVGAELNSMEKYSSHWRKLVAEVKKHFQGMLSYSANQGASRATPWKELDYVGIDAFFELTTPDQGATADDMYQSLTTWTKWATRVVVPFGKPIILSEVGSESEVNAHKKSWLWDHGTPVDLLDQSSFYNAVCRAWRPLVSGIYWWDVTLNPPADPLGDGSFSPLGKPAEAEIKKCFQ